MPQGKGTYGSKVGRPPKKAKKGGKYALGGKIINPPEPIEQMMPEFDARQRSVIDKLKNWISFGYSNILEQEICYDCK